MGSPQAQQKIGFIYSIGLGSTKRDQAKVRNKITIHCN